MARRVFLTVLDSFGIGNAPDAASFGDAGSNTLAACCEVSDKPFTNLTKLGLFDIDGHNDLRILSFTRNQGNIGNYNILGSYGRMRELSAGKDTTIGHWEIAGLKTSTKLPTYPEGFPADVIDALEKVFGRKILCNKPYSGTEVIKDFGIEHMKSGSPIVYTSADSVLQIACHESVVPLDELYAMCREARKIMCGKHAVGRIIARPFVGTCPEDFKRTTNRRDFSLEAPSATMLDILSSAGRDVIAVGKIHDIFAERGITETITTTGNTDGIKAMLDLQDRDFEGLCFINLVDFDMLYGHRNDSIGYARALHEFDDALSTFIPRMRPDDLLIITADHGCDPSTASTDHSREQVPVLIYGENFNVPHNLGSLAGFDNVSSIVLTSLLSSVTPKMYIPPVGSHVTSRDNLMSFVDMTNLKTVATVSDIADLIEKAVSSDCASVCVQPCFVRDAVSFSRGRIAVCTVIGFPNGYNTTAAKVFEAIDACDNGASEIDMVINITFVKSGRFDLVAAEISALASAVHERGAILKVIIETAVLTEEEKIRMCQIVTDCGADFIKTSTGFAATGATLEDVSLFKANVGPNVKIKAAGGIRTSELANQMIDAGANRIGASNLK